jgi:hypothetical protein
MKTKGWNKLPLWARFFGVLFGFPVMVAIVRVALEQWFPRLTADLIVLVALMIIVTITLCWKRKNQTHQPDEVPVTKEDRQHEKREVHKLSCLMFALFSIVLLTGTFFGFCIMFAATPEGYPMALFYVFRIFGAGIGLVSLLLTFVCFEQTKFELLLLMGHKPSRDVSVSYKAGICALVIVLAIAFAIVRLFHL